MNQQYRYRPFPASNPLANALVVIVGIVVITLSLALGYFNKRLEDIEVELGNHILIEDPEFFDT